MDNPPGWAVSRGGTCQLYIDKGLDMAHYCSALQWIEYKFCGQTCEEYGVTTDPECHKGKLFTNNLGNSLLSIQ